MKFDRLDWKILAFKVGIFFVNIGLQFRMTLTAICEFFLHDRF